MRPSRGAELAPVGDAVGTAREQATAQVSNRAMLDVKIRGRNRLFRC
jgi:hypothetical protein